MSRHLRRTAAALGAALLAAAVPAAARADAPSHVPVPAGQLQHTVTELSFPAAKNTQSFHALREERWMGAEAGRELTTDLTTGKVREDCQFTLTEDRCWAAPLNSIEPALGQIYVMPGTPLLLRSWADEGSGVKAMLDQGFYRVTGSTTFLGHAALTVADKGPSPAPDGGLATTSIIADAGTYYPLWREDRATDQPYTSEDGTKGKQQVDQVTETKVMEVISPAGVPLTIAAHPGAKVVVEGPGDASAAARRKAAAKRRAAARRKAAAKHRRHHKKVAAKR